MSESQYPDYADGIPSTRFREIQVERLVTLGFKRRRAFDFVRQCRPAAVSFAFDLLDDILPVVGYSVDPLIDFLRVDEYGYVRWDLDDFRRELGGLGAELPGDGQHFCFDIIRAADRILKKLRANVINPEENLRHYLRAVLGM